MSRHRSDHYINNLIRGQRGLKEALMGSVPAGWWPARGINRPLVRFWRFSP